jgi:hypothetical protein
MYFLHFLLIVLGKLFQMLYFQVVVLSVTNNNNKIKQLFFNSAYHIVSGDNCCNKLLQTLCKIAVNKEWACVLIICLIFFSWSDMIKTTLTHTVFAWHNTVIHIILNRADFVWVWKITARQWENLLNQ